MEVANAVVKICVVVIAAVVTVLTGSGTVVLSEVLVVNICGVVIVTGVGLTVTAVVRVVVAIVVATETVAVGVVFGCTRVLAVLVVALVVVVIRVVLLTVLFLVVGVVVGVVVFGGAGFVVLGAGGSRVTMGTGSVGTETIENQLKSQLAAKQDTTTEEIYSTSIPIGVFLYAVKVLWYTMSTTGYIVHSHVVHRHYDMWAVPRDLSHVRRGVIHVVALANSRQRCIGGACGGS